jgi:hypothetical protein
MTLRTAAVNTWWRISGALPSTRSGALYRGGILHGEPIPGIGLAQGARDGMGLRLAGNVHCKDVFHGVLSVRCL